MEGSCAYLENLPQSVWFCVYKGTLLLSSTEGCVVEKGKPSKLASLTALTGFIVQQLSRRKNLF